MMYVAEKVFAKEARRRIPGILERAGEQFSQPHSKTSSSLQRPRRSGPAKRGAPRGGEAGVDGRPGLRRHHLRRRLRRPQGLRPRPHQHHPRLRTAHSQIPAAERNPQGQEVTVDLVKCVLMMPHHAEVLIVLFEMSA